MDDCIMIITALLPIEDIIHLTQTCKWIYILINPNTYSLRDYDYNYEYRMLFTLDHYKKWFQYDIPLTEFMQMDNLIRLNGPMHIPASIHLLNNLKYINFMSCSIKSLSELCNISSLTYLNLSNNNITYIPHEIGHLTNLSYLGIANNNLEVLPASLCTLTNLTILNVPSNRLTELPSNIDNLQKLIYLDISDNRLDVLPSTFTNLTNLIILNLAGNDIL